MRRNRENQLPLSGRWPDHRLAQELKAVSKILDDNPSILELVLYDLCDMTLSAPARKLGVSPRSARVRRGQSPSLCGPRRVVPGPAAGRAV